MTLAYFSLNNFPFVLPNTSEWIWYCLLKAVSKHFAINSFLIFYSAILKHYLRASHSQIELDRTMSSKGAADVRVFFKDDDSQDTLLYTGDRVVGPCNCPVINAGEECLDWGLKSMHVKLQVKILKLKSEPIISFLN